MTWGQCGEALARLQDSLFLDRDYWVLGNMDHRSQRGATDARRHGARWQELTDQRGAGGFQHAARSVRLKLEGRHVARRAVGVVLLALGLVGLLMPILPGWFLIFAGLALLGVKLPFLERMKGRTRPQARRKPNA
jgi:hypothetical protein